MRSFPRSARHWGLARKGLNIFLRECLYTVYLRDHFRLGRGSRHFEIPLDSLTGKELWEASNRELPRWRPVKGLKPEISDRFQAMAGQIARERGIDRVHLDALWWGQRTRTGPNNRVEPTAPASCGRPGTLEPRLTRRRSTAYIAMTLLPNEGGQLLEEPEYFGERTFLKAALARFPQLVGDADLEIGIHLSMAALARVAMGALRSGDTKQARAVVDFVEEVLASPRLHPKIRDAVACSFLEPSELGTFPTGRELLDSMPPQVRELLG